MNAPDPIEPAVECERRANGEIILRCPFEPGTPPKNLAQLLIDRAAEVGDRTLVAERDGDGWSHLTYADALAGARAIAQWFIDRGAGESTPLAILTGSSIKHFLMAWGAILARVPVVPVSTSYSTVRGAWPKLEAVLQTVEPVFLFAEHPETTAPALEAIDFDLANRVIIDGSDEDAWRAMIATGATDAVDDSIAQIDHDTVARYMFTSGSTGMPKGVIVTHGMTCHMIASSSGMRDTPDLSVETRVLDWMPWSHVGAGVMRIGSMINAGGSIYLDTGKPVPGEFDKTLENIRSVGPTQFGGAPLGWSMLVDALEQDDAFAADFFANIRSMQFGSAAMAPSLAERIRALCVRYLGQELPMGTSLMSTEVHVGISRYWPCDRHEVMGLPVPSCELKLLPLGDKYELRVRSPGVTPGYLNDPGKTADSFDEEGFFKMGDAVRFADDDDPAQGLIFAGRVAEEFKLVSGTWVSAGTLRSQAIAAASPLVRDVVVCGLNRDYVALLIWPNLAACESLAGSPDAGEVVKSAAVKERILEALAQHNAQNPGSSTAIRRFLLLAELPDPGAFEITDKGYINQRAVQERRAEDVERLFAAEPDAEVVVV